MKSKRENRKCQMVQIEKWYHIAIFKLDLSMEWTRLNYLQLENVFKRQLGQTKHLSTQILLKQKENLTKKLEQNGTDSKEVNVKK